MKPKCDKMAELIAEISKNIECWKDIRKNGCSDPGWPDGVNLNLVRNHVIYHKAELQKLCAAENMDLPPEYYLPTPPYVDNNFFAKPRSERAQRIMNRPGWRCANQEPIQRNYEERQLSLF